MHTKFEKYPDSQEVVGGPLLYPLKEKWSFHIFSVNVDFWL